MREPEQVPRIVAFDLFCGAGGLTHGLIQSGVDVRAGLDIDPACRFPFEQNNFSEFVEKDIDDMTAADIRPFLEGADYTLLAGCAPCQPFSTYSRSGRSKKKGLDWKLVLKFGWLVEELVPDFVTMENVPQLAGHDVFQTFLKSLHGYDVVCEKIECSSLGVPQSRQRLVLVASRVGGLDPALLTSSPSLRTVRSTISRLRPICAGESDPNDSLHVSPSLSATNMRRIRASTPGGSWRDWEPSLRAACHQKTSGATYPSVYGRMEWDKIAPTITTQCFGYGNGRFGHPEQDRAISLREAAMLQTFPQSYRFVKDDEPVRFNRLGRLIGNAVPVRLGEVVGDFLMDHARSTRTVGKV